MGQTKEEREQLVHSWKVNSSQGNDEECKRIEKILKSTEVDKAPEAPEVKTEEPIVITPEVETILNVETNEVVKPLSTEKEASLEQTIVGGHGQSSEDISETSEDVNKSLQNVTAPVMTRYPAHTCCNEPQVVLQREWTEEGRKRWAYLCTICQKTWTEKQRGRKAK